MSKDIFDLLISRFPGAFDELVKRSFKRAAYLDKVVHSSVFDESLEDCDENENLNRTEEEELNKMLAQRNS